MCGLGATEMMVILILALLVFGPSKLPELAKGVGKALREFKKASKEIKGQVSSDEELGAAMREVEAARLGVSLPDEDDQKKLPKAAEKAKAPAKAKAKVAAAEVEEDASTDDEE